jgi:hypothetical protein
MIKLTCHTWNSYLPKQGLFDSTCGYHAIRNGISMLKLLNENKIQYKNYVSSIKETKNYKLLISERDLNKDLHNYVQIYKSNKLCKQDLLKIAGNFYNLNNVFITYLDNEFLSKEELIRLNDIKRKRMYKICFIFYVNDINLVKHWVPIVLDKNGNDIKLHILDSYNYVWFGDKKLNFLLDKLYKRMIVKCNNDNLKGTIIFSIKNITIVIIYVFFIYLFILGFQNKKL